MVAVQVAQGEDKILFISQAVKSEFPIFVSFTEIKRFGNKRQRVNGNGVIMHLIEHYKDIFGGLQVNGLNNGAVHAHRVYLVSCGKDV